MLAAARSAAKTGEAAAAPTMQQDDAGDDEDAPMLESEVSQVEAESMFTYVQSISTSFRGFTEEEVPSLVELFSVMRVEAGQTLVQRGEPGTWFGIILSGTIIVELPSFQVTLPIGSIIGEMVIWVDGAKRGATMKGGQPGMVAIMLRSHLPKLLSREPVVGLKLLKMMGKSAMSKQLDNMRRERSKYIKPNISWQSADASSKTALAELLVKEADLSGEQAKRVAEVAQMTAFKEGEVVVEAGAVSPFVMIVLEGALSLDRFALEVGESGHIGTLEYLGEEHLRDSSKVSSKLHHLASSPLISPHLPTSARLVQGEQQAPSSPSSPLISPHLPASPLISPHLASSPLISPHFASSRLISPHLASSRLISPHLPTSARLVQR